MADTDQAAKAAVVVVDAGAKQPPASQPGPLQEEQEVGPGQQAAVMAPPPSPGEDAKVRSLAASVDGVVEAEVDKGQGNGKGASDGGAAAAGLASPEAAPRGEGSTGASAGEQQPPQPQPAPSTPAGAGQDGGGGSPAPQLRTPATGGKASSGGNSSTSTSTTNALVAELCSVLLRRAGAGGGYGGSSSSLPEERELVAAHCLGLVRVLREVEALRQHIERESLMERDCQSYMRVCETQEAKATQAKLRVLQKLRGDFDEKNAALRKELRGLREQITTLRGRAQQAAWPPHKKAGILAALQRFEGLHERELKALQITESATEELHKARMQLPKLPEEVDVLLELVAKMRRVSKTLAKLGMPAMNEARIEGVWAQVLEMLRWRPIADIVEETGRALKDLKDVKLSEAKRRNEQHLRLLSLCDDKDSDVDQGRMDEEEDDDEEEEEDQEEGDAAAAPAAVPSSVSAAATTPTTTLLPLPAALLQPIAEDERSQASGSSGGGACNRSEGAPSPCALAPVAPLTAADAVAGAIAAAPVEFEACADSWAAIFPERGQQGQHQGPEATTSPSQPQQPQPPQPSRGGKGGGGPGSSSSYRPGSLLDEGERRRRLYGGKTQPPELLHARRHHQGPPGERASMYVSRTLAAQRGQQVQQRAQQQRGGGGGGGEEQQGGLGGLQPSGSTDSLSSLSSVGSVRSVSSMVSGGGFDRPTASSRARGFGGGGGGSRGPVGGGGRVVGRGGGGVGPQATAAGRSQSFYMQRGAATKL